MALLPLLGCTWIIGLLFVFNSESAAVAWIFTIVNSLQVTIIVSRSERTCLACTYVVHSVGLASYSVIIGNYVWFTNHV